MKFKKIEQQIKSEFLIKLLCFLSGLFLPAAVLVASLVTPKDRDEKLSSYKWRAAIIGASIGYAMWFFLLSILINHV